jgi:hypothetical protein
MAKRKISEEERQRRVLYQRAYRAQKSCDPTWRKKECERKKVKIIEKNLNSCYIICRVIISEFYSGF